MWNFKLNYPWRLKLTYAKSFKNNLQISFLFFKVFVQLLNIEFLVFSLLNPPCLWLCPWGEKSMTKLISFSHTDFCPNCLKMLYKCYYLEPKRVKLILVNIIIGIVIYCVVKHLHRTVLLRFSEGVPKKRLSFLMYTLFFHSVTFIAFPCFSPTPWKCKLFNWSHVMD